MEFIKHHPKLVSIVSLAIIGLAILANLLYFIFLPIEAQGDPAGFVETPMPNQQIITRMPETVVTSPTSMVVLVILLAIVLLGMVILFAGLKYFESKRKQRDKQRKEDLKTLAQAFEAYRQIHGQYPLSSTYRPEYYTGVNLSNDWNYYGLPGTDHMSHFIPNWPISDPAIDYMSRNQVNQYLYYPKENGQKFFLYAHLEAPKKNEEIDYNMQDNLLRSWGHYNYRVESGQEQPIQVDDQHKTAPPTPLPPQPQTPQPSGLQGAGTSLATPQATPTAAPPPAEVTTARPANPMPATDNQIPVQPSPAQSEPEYTSQTATQTEPITQPAIEPQAQDSSPIESPIASLPPTPQTTEASNQEQPALPPTVTLPLAGPVQNPIDQPSQEQGSADEQSEEPRLITPDIR